MYQIRIEKELALLESSPPEGIQLISRSERILTVKLLSNHMQANLKIEVPERYPIVPPIVTCNSPIPFHPNIDRTGNICLDLLNKKEKDGSWKPSIGIVGLCMAIKLLLDNPNVDDPLNMEAADLYVRDREAYYRKNTDSPFAAIKKKSGNLLSSNNFEKL